MMNTESFYKAQQILKERFGHDVLIALATVDQDQPSVRTVNAYYEDGRFFIITHEASNKMLQKHTNPNVAISGDWFTAHGKDIIILRTQTLVFYVSNLQTQFYFPRVQDTILISQKQNPYTCQSRAFSSPLSVIICIKNKKRHCRFTVSFFHCLSISNL